MNKEAYPSPNPRNPPKSLTLIANLKGSREVHSL